ncbi:hypothetical protein [Cerasicoccus fimbriatus]|uniref:hypothetical protein n=1 Tax=Cerasicoccus fimbriatus TaxID=3014554 RepID=UPI0022B4286A|nr:hypothetical protein [Cerasicoccus sp. TK19100]
MALSPTAKRNLIISSVLLLLLVAATPFAWQKIKETRAADLAADALKQIEDENYGAAWESAKAAYALDPDNPEVARTLAGILNEAQPDEAPALWEKVYALTGDEADLLAWFDSELRMQNMSALRRLSERLAKDFPNSPDALQRRAQSALFNNQLDQAINLLRTAAQHPDATADVQFGYVKLSQRSENEAIRSAGIDWLKQMAQRPDDIGLQAARSLLTMPGLSREQLLSYAEKLAQHPMATREDRLAEIVIRRQTGEQSMDELLAEAQSLFALEDPGELVELGRWLNQQGRSADFLELVDFDTAISRRDLFLVWIDSMAITQQWAELDKVVDRPRLPLDPFTIVLFRSRIQQELGNDRVSNLIWGRALLTADDSISKLEFAYDYALKMGWSERANEVLEKLVKIPATQRKAFEEMLKLNQRSGDVLALQSALRRMAEKYPHDNDVANDLAYVNLLQGEDIQGSYDTAVRLLRESSQPFLANIITHALALYLGGEKQLALDQLYPLAINWSETRPRDRAIYAAILAANGHKREAQDMIRDVDPEELLPPEREILREAQL